MIVRDSDRVLVQGITGRQGTFWTGMTDYVSGSADLDTVWSEHEGFVADFDLYADALLNGYTVIGLSASGRLAKEKLENNYGIKTNQALQIGKFKNLDDAIKVSNNKKILNQKK